MSLQDEQDAARAARAPLGEELLLQAREALAEQRRDGLGIGLGAVEARRGVGGDRPEVDVSGVHAQQVGDAHLAGKPGDRSGLGHRARLSEAAPASDVRPASLKGTAARADARDRDLRFR